MIKDNQKRLNHFHVVLDACVIACAYALAWFIVNGTSWFNVTGHNKSAMAVVYLAAGVLIVPFYLILYAFFHLYTPKRVQGRRVELANIFKANIIGLLVISLILYLGGKNEYFHNFSRPMVFLFFGINLFAEILMRNILRIALRSMRSKGYNQKHLLLVGYSRAAEEYIDRIQQNPQWGYVVRGILDDNVPAGTVYNGIKVIGRIANLSVILPANRLDEIAITLGLSEYYRLEEIVGMCEKSGVHTKFIPDYNKIIPTKPYTEDILGLPVINIRYVPLSNTFNAMVKRLMDVVGAIMAIIVSSPVMLLMCILIKLTSPGPLIYRQERVGLHNKNFWMYKFRSMEIQPEAEEKKAWTVKNDPRVTGIGKFMRRTSIDELPQLFNILKGDMSLVGPRPERPFFVEKFREEIPRYMVKHQVRPGLTGWAQVNGYRGDTSIRKRIDCDLYYIENWSIGFDIKILFLTIFKGFINKNAY